MSLFDVKCQCPSCFEEIYLGECKIMSGVTKQPLKEPKGPFARMVVERLDGPEYTLEAAYRVCTECNYALPHDIERVPSIILAVVGDTHSGKSHYLASLIHHRHIRVMRLRQPRLHWHADRRHRRAGPRTAQRPGKRSRRACRRILVLA